MALITQTDNLWQITGDVQFANTKSLLDASRQLTFFANTVVDLKAVDDIDSAAISLILEWKRRAQAENKALAFINLPPNLNSLAMLYGVRELIC